METNVYQALPVLLKSHDSSAIHVFSLSKIIVDEVSCETLNSKVELVAVCVAPETFHGVVRPEITFMPIHILVILNSLKSQFKVLSV